MKTQRVWIEELSKLMAERPELEVIFFVDSEAICNDWGYTSQKIFKIEIEDCYEDGWGEIHVGEDDITDHFLDQLEDEGLAETEFEAAWLEARAEKEFREKAKEAIFVYLSV